MRASKAIQVLICAALLGLAPPAHGQDLAVQPGYEPDEWVKRNAAIRLDLNRRPEPSEGRIAIFIGSTDVTDLFEMRSDRLVYRPEVVPLPPGEREIAVYLVTPENDWREVGRFPLRVLTRRGFEEMAVTPRLDLRSEALVDQGSDGNPSSDEETGFKDLDGQFDLQARFLRPGLHFNLGFNVIGVTEQARALRFGEEGEDAPKLDLSSYNFRFQRGGGWVELGHVSFGQSRHLISGFSSRGMTVAFPLWEGAELGLAALNGASIVGWDNIAGLSRSDHQILSGRLAFEVLPAHPGTLRVEGTFLDGSLLPISGFNEGEINDAETSRGFGFGFQAAAFHQRLRLEGSYSESEFDNPFDPDLAQGTDLVPVEPEERSARYLHLSFDLLKDRTLGQGFATTWTLGYRHEQVEPQYRSVASYVRADLEQDTFDLTGSLGPVALQASHSRSQDNLDDVPSILTTKTRRDAANLAVPLAQILMRGKESGVWLPLLTYSYDRTHQFGLDVPENSLFNESHVPDQVSVNHVAGLEWSGGNWRLGYRFNYSDQDNRQTGRERADFATAVHGLDLSLTPHQRFDLGFEVSRERAANQEFDQIQRTLRYGLNALWRTTQRSTLTANLSWTETEDEPRTREGQDWITDLQWAWRFERRAGEKHGLSGQFFVRYSNQEFDTLDTLFGLVEDRRSWRVNSGINLSIF